MEVTTLGFAYLQLRQWKRNEQARDKALSEFDEKYLNRLKESGASTGPAASIITRSTDSKGSRRMFSMESLEECLNTNYDGLQHYASSQELNGENIIFLVKILSFRKQCESVLAHFTDSKCAMTTLYRSALNVFITLIHPHTANYPINIESTLYNTFDAVFGPATELVASTRTNSMTSANSCVAPWDEPPPDAQNEPGSTLFQMVTMLPMTPTTQHFDTQSNYSASDHIISSGEPGAEYIDPLADFEIPAGFNEKIFDEAYKKVRYLVWCGTWQRYMEGKRSSSTV